MAEGAIQRSCTFIVGHQLRFAVLLSDVHAQCVLELDRLQPRYFPCSATAQRQFLPRSIPNPALVRNSLKRFVA